MQKTNRSTWMLMASMFIFGTLSPFVRNISVSSGELALYRAILAAVCIGGFLLATRQTVPFRSIRKELLLPLLCGIFLAEAVVVMLQVGYFKYTKRKYGEGRRIFLMSPLHHHYQKKGVFETKIMIRFTIVSIILAALTLVTLKIR